MTHTRRSFLGTLLGAACAVLGAAYGWHPGPVEPTVLDEFEKLLCDQLAPIVQEMLHWEHPIYGEILSA